jgi:hypothetical protein
MADDGGRGVEYPIAVARAVERQHGERTPSASSVMPGRKNMARRMKTTLPVPPILSRASSSMARRASTSAQSHCSSRWAPACWSTARMLLTVNMVSATSFRTTH